MDQQNINTQNKIRVIFTEKADLALEEIIKAFNLEETPEDFLEKNKNGKLSNVVLIDRIIKDFIRGAMPEKYLTDALQKDLGVSPQTAEQITKKIVDNIIPFLEKVSEENLKDPAFAEELSKKIGGVQKTSQQPQPIVKKPEFSNVEENEVDLKEERKPIIDSEPKKIEKAAELNPIEAEKTLKKPRKVKKVLEDAEEINEPPQKITQPEQPKYKGPDKYRESVE